jgi:hypothetical protein
MFRLDVACFNCPGGKFSDGYNAKECSECPHGQYSISQSTLCTNCPKGKFHSLGSTECRNCEAGTFQAWDGKTNCFHCPSGKYQNLVAYHDCYHCPEYHWTHGKSGQTACELLPMVTSSCSRGMFMFGHSCFNCPRGKYNDHEDASVCHACAVDTYSPSHGSTRCYPCPAGKFTRGAERQHLCVEQTSEALPFNPDLVANTSEPDELPFNPEVLKATTVQTMTTKLVQVPLVQPTFAPTQEYVPVSVAGLAPFSELLVALPDSDPALFAEYDTSSNITSSTCMGGYAQDLSVYSDCTTILGFLVIAGSSETNTDKLRNLQRIVPLQDMVGPGGNALTIANNSQLLSVSGLVNLISIAGGVLIQGNRVLASTEGVGRFVETVGSDSNGRSFTVSGNALLKQVTKWTSIRGGLPGGVVVEHNGALEDILGMTVPSIGGGLRLEGNMNLLRVDGFDELVTVGKDANGDGLVLKGNSKLHAVNLGTVVSVGGSLRIEDSALESLDGVRHVQYILGDVHIEGNAELQDINDLDGVKGAVPGMIYIASNPKLGNVNGLSGVSSCGSGKRGMSVSVTDNALLVDLNGLATLAGALTGSMVISSNPAMTDLTGLEGVTELGADTDGQCLVIWGNTHLTNVNGLQGLQSVLPGAVSITGNLALQDLGGLDAVAGIAGADAEGDALVIGSNPQLTTIASFSGMHGNLTGALRIYNNARLDSLAGLQHIAGIHGRNKHGVSLEIQSNDELLDLNGLSGLNGHLDGALIISSNPKLEHLSGVSGITAIDHAGTNQVGFELMSNNGLANLDSLDKLCAVRGDILVKGNQNLDNISGLVRGLEQRHATLGTSITVADVGCVTDAEKAALAQITPITAIQDNGSCVAPAAVCTGSATVVGQGNQSICGRRVNGPHFDAWTVFGSTGLYADIDTSSCSFTEAQPKYVSSIAGDHAHWDMVGSNNIYQATATGFRVYIFHPSVRGAYLQYIAKRYRWRISWLADAGQSSGRTRPGSTGWAAVAGSNTSIALDVCTSKSAFQQKPVYVTAMHGAGQHWSSHGVHAIRRVTKHSFRVVVSYPTAITPAFAETNNWTVVWVGSVDSTNSGRSSSADWQDVGAVAGNSGALRTEVDTSKLLYARTPAYVSTISEGPSSWSVAAGASAIYAPTSSGFRVYLPKPKEFVTSTTSVWTVNYIAFAPAIDCVVSDWSAYGACSKSCGGGVATRRKIVVSPALHSGACNHSLTSDTSCNLEPCNLDCHVSAWSPFTACSSSCGRGEQTRSRQIVAAPIQHRCPPLSQVSICDAGPCPLECNVTSWAEWSVCSKTCGIGQRVRTRAMVSHAAEGPFACPSLVAAEQCLDQVCRTNCRLSQWSSWGGCSRTCGQGTAARYRDIRTFPSDGAERCAATVQLRVCDAGPCPDGCDVSPWSLWSACSRSCGGGVKTRARHVLYHEPREGVVCPVLSEDKQCSHLGCPAPCQVSAWGGWGSCSTSCASGVQARGRNVTSAASGGGDACPELSEQRECSTAQCPVDCVASPWTPWAMCSATCGAGSMWRMRLVVRPSAHGGKPCSSRLDHKACDAGLCPVGCDVTDWTNWNPCSKSCGTGFSIRARGVQSQAVGGTCPALQERRECNAQPCAADCVASAWGLYTDCSKPCVPESAAAGSIGQQTRHRTVLRPAAGAGQACPPLRATRQCNQQRCPLDCEASAWAAHSACSTTCGWGSRVRTREVTVHAAFGGEVCPHKLSKELPCYAGDCPSNCDVSDWGGWNQCSSSCGGDGFQVRRRGIVTHATNGGFVCPALNQVRSCGVVSCPVDCSVSSWTAWDACSRTCGMGLKTHHRLVETKSRFGGALCPLSLHEMLECDAGPCPVHCLVSDWNSWTPCTKTCAGGSQLRSRTVAVIPAHGGFVCPVLEQQRDCNMDYCPVDCALSEWTVWDACSKSCKQRRADAPGARFRRRSVLTHPLHGGVACLEVEQSQECGTVKCDTLCVVSAWTEWAACSVSCQGGTTTRTRTVVNEDDEPDECPLVYEETTCHEWACPQSCEVSQWSTWGGCTKSCGTGVRTKTRSVLQAVGWGGVACPLLTESEECNAQPCAVDCLMTAFTAWTACSVTCATGASSRTRTIATVPQLGGKACESLHEEKSCYMGICCKSPPT